MKHRAAMPNTAAVVWTTVIKQTTSVPTGCMPRMRQTRTGQGSMSHITNNGSTTAKNDVLRGLVPVLHAPMVSIRLIMGHQLTATISTHNTGAQSDRNHACRRPD